MAILESTGFLHFISSCIKQGEEYVEHFRSGFNGEGWKLWETKENRFKLEIDDLTVRGTMSIYEMLIHKMRAVRGYLGLTQASGKIKSITDSLGGIYYHIELEEDIASIEPLDHVRCIAGTRSYWVTVSSIKTENGSNYIDIAKTEFEDGTVPLVGDELIQFGTADVSRKERQSAIMLHVDGETGDPAIDVMFGITEKNFNNCIKIRLGSGIDGNTAYSGLYCVNGLLKSVNDTNVEMYRFNPDGSGHIAQGNISWDKDGKVLFSDSVILQWTNAASESLSQEMSAKIDALTISNPNLLSNSDKFSAPIISGSGATATLNDSSLSIVISELGDKQILGLLQYSVFDSSLMADEDIAISFKIKSPDSVKVPKLKFNSPNADPIWINTTGSVSTEYSVVSCQAKYSTDLKDIGLLFSDAIGTYEITEFKVERGLKSSDWSPYIKDITSRLTRITSSGIYTGSLTAQQVNAVKISASSIKTGELDASLIKVGTLNGDRLQANSINGNTIQANTLDGNTIKANTINAASIITNTLTSLGHITTGTFSLASGKFSVDSSGKFIATDGDLTGKITSTSGQIGSWSINSDAIFRGVYTNTGFTSNSSSITIGSNGIRGFKWALNSDGTGSLAAGKISWDNSGIVTFDPSIQLLWTNAAKAAADAIEVGGRNLLTNSNKYGTVECAAGITRTFEDNAIKFISTSGNANWARYLLASSVFNDSSLKAGDLITMSFRIKSTGSSIPPKIFFKDGMGYYSMVGTVGLAYSTVYVTVPYVVNASGMSLHLGFSEAIGTYWIKDFKIERGNKATDWTPAPEDTLASISAAQTATATAQATIDALNNKATTENWSTKLTFIGSTGIFTGTLSANLVQSLQLNASQITAGTIDAARITAVGAVTAGSFQIGTDKFVVTPAGILSAKGATIDGTITATAGKIAGWNISGTDLYIGTLKTSGFTTDNSSITIGTSGIRGFKWQLNKDGSGSLADGKISWNAAGSLTFGSDVVLQWNNLSTETQTNLKGEAGDPGINGTSIIWKGSFSSNPSNPVNGWAYYNTTECQSYTYQNGWYLLAKDSVLYEIQPDVSIIKRNASGVCNPESVGFKVFQIKGGKRTEVDYYYKGTYASTAAAVTALGTPSAGWWVRVGTVDYRYDGAAWAVFTPVDTNLSLKVRIIVNDDFGWGKVYGPYPFVTGKISIPAERNTIDAEVYMNAGGWTEPERLAKVRVVVVDDGAKGDSGVDANLLPWVSQWNNNTTLINGESVISPRMFSGTRSATTQKLTGVAMGRFTDSSAGIFGINEDVITFSLDSTTGAITSTLGTIGGWTIGNGYLEIKNTTSNHWLRLNSSGYLCNRLINGSTDFWSLKEDGGATFAQGKAVFNSDGSGNIAAGKISWSTNGTVTLDASLIANSIATNALTVGKFKVSTTGILEATDAILSGKVSATDGSIGGFTIGSNRIGAISSGTEDIGSASGLSLYAGFIKFADADRWASIGLNVLPANSGYTGVGRFQNHTHDSNAKNRGVEISVMNGGYNIALHTIGNVVSNNLVTSYNPNKISPLAFTAVDSDISFGNTFLLDIKYDGTGVCLPRRMEVSNNLGLPLESPFSVRITYIGLYNTTYNTNLWGRNSTISTMDTNTYPKRVRNDGFFIYDPVVMGSGDVVEFQLVWDGSEYVAYLIGARQ